MAYKMTHPDSKTEITVNADAVAMYESQGWQRSPHAPAPEAPPATEAEVAAVEAPKSSKKK